MTRQLAILAGSGALPVAMLAAVPDAICVTFSGQSHDLTGPVREHRLERLGDMFADLRAAGVSDIVMGGAMHPPQFDPTQLDDLMTREAPRLMAALGQGDDAILRAVIGLIETNGFRVLGAHDVAPDLTVTMGAFGTVAPDVSATKDIARARDILKVMGPLDIGQGVVVAGGRCLGVETAQGTDSMLDFVARTDPARRPNQPGVLVKAPKAGQDLRVDMPAIGPDTIHAAARAGLAGVAVTAGQTLVLDRDAVQTTLDATGLFLWADAP